MEKFTEEYGINVMNELASVLLGEKLGRGAARTVYEHALDKRYVIKVENYAGSFQNIIEWETWQNLQHTAHAKWLAPCVSISPSGSVLIMCRTTPRNIDQLPKKLPSFLSDTKVTNYGKFRDRVVCHDYGLLLSNGINPKLRTVRWRDE